MLKTKKLRLSLLLLTVFFGVLSFVPFAWQDTIDDLETDLQFHFRGDRQLSDKIIAVFISDEDIKTLGGWPLTRDYYSYAIHALSSGGAKVIGLDLLFSDPGLRHPEYDAALAEFIKTAGIVCLPIVLSDVSQDSILHDSENIIYPLAEIKAVQPGMGFSNLENDAVIRTSPVIVNLGDSLLPSFGLEMARIYLNAEKNKRFKDGSIFLNNSNGEIYEIPVDDDGNIRLNHFGGLENIKSIGFVNLIKSFESLPDSFDLKDKLALVFVSAAGVSVTRSTPLSAAFPVSLIHATITENILENNFLRTFTAFYKWLLCLSMIFTAMLMWKLKSSKYLTALAVLMLPVYIFTANIIFTYLFCSVPLIYPLLAFTAAHFLIFFFKYKENLQEDISVKTLLQEQTAVKESELHQALQKQKEIQNRLEEEQSEAEQMRKTAIEKEEEVLTLQKELDDLHSYTIEEHNPEHTKFSKIIYSENSKMKEVLDLAATVASDNIPVLILGDTGTGKEMIANAVHQRSPRKDEAFTAINCGALSETLLESELFGHEKGSFTGAVSRRKGRFELADKGTVFLDEISETTPAFQARLLRVLQEGTFERLGGEETIKVDIRILAASNRNLQQEIDSGSFRSDLFYRLNGFQINLPPLHERREDIPLLAAHFLKKHGYETVTEFSGRAVETLQAYRWPGNVRELENIVRRAAILAQGAGRKIIQAADFPEEIFNYREPASLTSLHKPLEVQILESLRALEFSHSAISQTAKALGNKDRGTITEYFRGMCFEQLVNSNFDKDACARQIAGSEDENTVSSVLSKLDAYLNNLRSHIQNSAGTSQELQASPAFRGLPKKYHPYLQQVIDYLSTN